MGDRTIGASISLKMEGAKHCFSQSRKLEDDKFVRKGKDDDKSYWTTRAIVWQRVLGNTRRDSRRTVVTNKTLAPEWAADERYKCQGEVDKTHEIASLENEIAALTTRKETAAFDLHELGQFRGLLFENGGGLEQEVTKVLQMIGFETSKDITPNDGPDVIFSIEIHRFIGEVEGRDNAAINVDKFSQLERHLADDFARDDIDERAIGVLFGNPQRLTKPEERTADFTQKCQEGAKRAGIRLVRTMDLFWVAKQMLDTNDADYAKRCRDAIINTEYGIVDFLKE